MIHFEWLWAFLFTPIPFFVYRRLSPVQHSYAAIKAPFYPVLSRQHVSVARGRRLGLFLLILIWLFLLIASARPQWVGEPLTTALSGRDLMLAVDLSDSMKERDMFIGQQRVNRLQAVQSIAGEFIERREGDRIGLILFGSEAYLQSPLTLDRKSVKTLLDEAVIGIAGIQTAIGNAIALAVKRFSDRERGEKVLVLLTDGKNTAGTISPIQATRLAENSGMKIYTIAIGSERLAGLNSFLQGAAVDERTLQQIAEVTQGRYFRARNTQELEQIYALIDELEKTQEDAETLRPIRELFHWPAGTAMILLLLLISMLRKELH